MPIRNWMLKVPIKSTREHQELKNSFHPCCYHCCNWENVVFPYFEGDACGCMAWVGSLSCCRKTCVPQQGLDEWSDNSWVHWCCIEATKGSSWCQCIHPSLFLMPIMCTTSVQWSIASSQWGLRRSTSLLAAHECAGTLTWGLVNPQCQLHDKKENSTLEWEGIVHRMVTEQSLKMVWSVW